MNPLRPCPHREIIPGPLATPAALLAWSAALAAEGCERCAALPAPAPASLPPLPPDVAALLAQDGKAGARRAQQALDALGVGEELHGAIAARLAQQPGTGPWWRRWWAGWRAGALLDAAPAAMV
jgi:hypothetical protein